MQQLLLRYWEHVQVVAGINNEEQDDLDNNTNEGDIEIVPPYLSGRVVVCKYPEYFSLTSEYKAEDL